MSRLITLAVGAAVMFYANIVDAAESMTLVYAYDNRDNAFIGQARWFNSDADVAKRDACSSTALRVIVPFVSSGNAQRDEALRFTIRTTPPCRAIAMRVALGQWGCAAPARIVALPDTRDAWEYTHWVSATSQTEQDARRLLDSAIGAHIRWQGTYRPKAGMFPPHDATEVKFLRWWSSPRCAKRQ